MDGKLVVLVLFGFVRLALPQQQCTESTPVPHCMEGFSHECHTDTEDRCSEFNCYPASRVVIPAGGTVTLYCEHPMVDATWHRGSSVIGEYPAVDGRCDCYQGPTVSGVFGQFLTFNNFQGHDDNNGEETLSCWSDLGGGTIVSCDFQVVVAAAPTITLNPTTIMTNENADLTITPTTNNPEPAPTYSWYFHNTLINSTIDPKYSINATTGSLKITGIRARDRGVYRVVATNSAGSDDANVTVFVKFLELSDPIFSGIDDDGNYVLTCKATGYPKATISWGIQDQDTNDMFVMGRTEFNVTSSIKLPSCDLNSISCTANAENLGNTRTTTNPCVAPPLNIILSIENSTSVRVTWNPPTGSSITGYKIQYYIRMDNIFTSHFIGVPETSFIVRGLQPNTEYTFRVGSLVSEDSNPLYSDGEMILIPSCELSPPTEEVTGLNAMLVSDGQHRTIQISWTESTEVGVTGYRLIITPNPTPLPSSFNMVISETSYQLPASSCNDQTYTFTVRAINRCHDDGPAQTVRRHCAIENANPVTVGIVSTNRYATVFELDITVHDSRFAGQSPISLYITATTLIVEDGKRRRNNFIINQFTGSRVCIGNLTENTWYNICVSLERDGEQVCKQERTGNVKGPQSDCNSPVATDQVEGPAQREERSGGGGISDLAIAGIVVGVLAVVALLFCFIGLFFACSTSKVKEGIYGSSLSLQASSLPPGVSPHMQNHRTVSPPSSCLSYHKQGHSTDWNEHRDTLRQMDTATGTHV